MIKSYLAIAVRVVKNIIYSLVFIRNKLENYLNHEQE